VEAQHARAGKRVQAPERFLGKELDFNPTHLRLTCGLACPYTISCLSCYSRTSCYIERGRYTAMRAVPAFSLNQAFSRLAAPVSRRSFATSLRRDASYGFIGLGRMGELHLYPEYVDQSADAVQATQWPKTSAARSQSQIQW
jgi:hypothetical protein